MSEAQRSSLALSWLNGYCHGIEHLAGALRAYLDNGEPLERAALLARLACLNFTLTLANSTKDRETVVDWFRRG